MSSPALLLTLVCAAISLPPTPAARTAAEVTAPSRLHLGHLMMEFDELWLDTAETAPKARALPHLARANRAFLRGDLAGTARSLADAQGALRRAEGATALELWAASISVMPERRTIDAGEWTGTIELSIGTHFPDAPPPPTGAEIECTGETFPAVRVPMEPDALRGALVIAPGREARGDHHLRVRLLHEGRELRAWDEVIGVLDAPFERYSRAIAPLKDSAASPEKLTSLGLGRELFSASQLLELPLPAATALERIERLARFAAEGGRDPELSAPGERWLVLPTGSFPTPCRLLVPPHEEGERLPLVVAVHGLGGSEHHFFEIYGRGLARELAARRGWILAAPGGLAVPRAGASIGEVVTALEELLPVDRARVFLIGHSLGAMRVMSAVDAEPARFRAIAPLSGGGLVGRETSLKGVPFLVAAGDRDFGLGMSQVLRERLRGAGAEVTFEEVPNADHIMVIPEVLPRVFQFFAEHLAADPSPVDRRAAAGADDGE